MRITQNVHHAVFIHINQNVPNNGSFYTEVAITTEDGGNYDLAIFHDKPIEITSENLTKGTPTNEQ